MINDINANSLGLAMDTQGLEHKSRYRANTDNLLAQGELAFAMYPSGIGVHCCDIVKQQQATSSVNLSACLSINILLSGNVGYSLGKSYYQFSASDKSPVLFINVLNKKEVFTRHLIDKQKVRKVNITIEKTWLLARCQSVKDFAQVDKLFNQTLQVYQWQCTPKLLALASQLIHHKMIADVAHELQAEQLALQVINNCLPLLLANQPPCLVKAKKIASDERILMKKKDHELEMALDKLLDQDLSLKEISQHIGISISTLQRKIKAAHNVTVIEYIRNKRLEKARKALIIDGLSIGETAFAAGYQHVTNFVTAFKQYFEITPAEFRKNHFLPGD